MTAARYRDFTFGVTRAVKTERNGHTYLQAEQPLQTYPPRITDRLQHWAATAPDRLWIARRVAGGDGWHAITYGQAWQQARSIGQALLNRGLGAEKPVVILSENSLNHALLALGCLMVGVPYCSVSPAYSLMSQTHDKLRHVLATLTPGLVYASDWARYGQAIEAALAPGTEVATDLVAARASNLWATTGFDSFLATSATTDVDTALQATGADTIAKFLFTSGSTKLPKAVINTHGMWCANQQQIIQSMPALAHEPVLVDWLPWNHTFGGNHNFGLVLYNGGSLYIDDGKPTPALMHETLRNLREVAPTAYFNVPTGFEAIAQAMKTDAVLRKNLLSRVKLFFYAGAALAQPVWDSLFDSQEREIGQRVVMGTGLGMTESGPYGLFVTHPGVKAGDLGLPTPGLQLKLVRTDGKTEVRYRGPNVTPGYWRNEDATTEAFDEEGFFCTGDAVQWIDETDIHQGLKFDGRIAEDFKLATGTFVSVGPLRAKIIAAGAPYVQDVVLTGINLHEVGALIFPTQSVRALANLPADAPLQQMLQSAAVQAHFQQLLNTLANSATGSASRIARAHLMHQPPNIDQGEVTDKGSINQRAVLQHRADLVQLLHSGGLPFTLQPQSPALLQPGDTP